MLLAVNPRMPTVRQDWQLFGKTAEAYSDAAQDILSILDSFSTTSTTISNNAKSLDALLLSAVGFSQSGINTIGGNQPNLVRAINILDPTTAVVHEVFADLQVPVPGRPVVPGPRWPRCIGRQRKIRDHGRRAC